DRVREAAAVSLPRATITIRRKNGQGYLRVSNPLEGGGAEQWPVGVIDGDVTPEDLDAFATGVHAEFAAADPQVRSQLVYTGQPGPGRERGPRRRGAAAGYLAAQLRGLPGPAGPAPAGGPPDGAVGRRPALPARAVRAAAIPHARRPALGRASRRPARPGPRL